MSADLLRRAAAVLRERAVEAEQAGYGSDVPGRPWCPNWTWTAVRHINRNMDIECDEHPDGEDCNTWGRYAGYHIATMHPGVGLALADWLDAAAHDEEWFARHKQATYGYTGENPAVTVARAVLGESA